MNWWTRLILWAARLKPVYEVRKLHSSERYVRGRLVYKSNNRGAAEAKFFKTKLKDGEVTLTAVIEVMSRLPGSPLKEAVLPEPEVPSESSHECDYLGPMVLDDDMYKPTCDQCGAIRTSARISQPAA